MQAFDACDENKDGFVSRTELLKAVKTNADVRRILNLPIIDLPGFPAYADVFDQIDKDRSGK